MTTKTVYQVSLYYDIVTVDDETGEYLYFDTDDSEIIYETVDSEEANVVFSTIMKNAIDALYPVKENIDDN